MEDLKNHPISITEVLRAQPIVQRCVKPTQLVHYEGLSRALGAEAYIKHENHNPTGTFKIRGGVNLMHHLRERAVSGVITYSTGNHGLSIATAAKWFGIQAVVVVPEGSNPAKIRAIRESGAELIEAGRTFEEAGATVGQLCEERGLYYAHPADEPHLINGVGTGFLEVIHELPDIEVMVVPLGAGSEAAAAITVLRAFRPEVQIVAVQAESSPAAYISWKEKRICVAPNKTFAGGFATGMAYETPFDIYQSGLDEFMLLTEEEIYESIGMALYYTHNLAEGAGASPIMAAFKLMDSLRGKKIVLQMSGCNASADEISRALTYECFKKGYTP